MLIYDHQIAWKNFEILGSETNKLLLELQVGLFIKKDKSILNSN